MDSKKIKPQFIYKNNPRVGLIVLATDVMIEKDFLKVFNEVPADLFVNRITNYNPVTSDNLKKMTENITSVTENILPGVTRKVILEIIQDSSLKCDETKISIDSFLSAKEIWVTNSTKGIIPIIELDGKKIGSGLPGEKYLEISKAFINKLSN